MAVMAYSSGIQKILAVPKLSEGKAEPTAVVIGEVLTEWNLKDCIVAVCFDTTAVNTGGKSGVSLRLEMMLDKPLLYFACRHHVLEILLDKVFSSLFQEQSNGTEVSLFLDFRNMWPQIDKTKYSTAMNDETIMLRVQPCSVSRVRYIVQDGWRGPFALKIRIFLYQFEQLRRKCSYIRGPSRNTNFREKLTDFCVFIVRYYVRAWFSTTLAAASPCLDLPQGTSIIKELASHINQAIRDAGTKVFSSHLWYLSEVTVGPALFDEEVSIMEKLEMVHSISTVKGLVEPSPRLYLNPEDVVSKNLSEFSTSTTKKLLQHLEIDSSFLGTDSVTWATTEAYTRGKERVTKLLVTNDVAERGVAAVHKEWQDQARGSATGNDSNR
ncbi:hypothetical protein GWK47_014489 [Chionoecetes opilio]|uniref:Uncharacterized protein n=1 Tax=Chionoecetes opilio TaxID=41210 RepID=A0A8J4XUM9_CHIOP|nr:hypothetical protein GWK47_014489 [Chionoecetes opilio]